MCFLKIWMSQHHQTWSLSLKMSHYVISTLKLLFTELCIYKKLEHHKLAKIRFLYTFNTIKHGGRGGSKCPRHFKMFVAAAGAYQWPRFFLLFLYIYIPIYQDLTKNLGFPAILAPQKRSLKKMTPPWLSMTPIFLSQNLFLL